MPSPHFCGPVFTIFSVVFLHVFSDMSDNIMAVHIVSYQGRLLICPDTTICTMFLDMVYSLDVPIPVAVFIGLIEIKQSFQQSYAKACKCMPKHANACKSMQKQAKACKRKKHAKEKSMQTMHAKACKSMQKHAKACKSTQKHTKACKSLQKHTKAYKSLQKLAKACKIMQKHALACKSMQKQAKACKSMGEILSWRRNEKGIERGGIISWQLKMF